MKYATTDEKNLPQGFYDSAIHGDKIPDEAMPLTDEQWQECIDNQGRRKVIDNGDGTSTVEEYTPPLPDLNVHKTAARNRVDLKAGEVRSRFPSPGYLVEEEYAQAEARAQAFADAGYPSGDVPDEVQSWADASGMTAQAAADDILVTAQAWRAAIAAVRRARLEGKAAIAAAADHAAVDAAEVDARAALDAIQPGA